jgi:hypothetical protein
MMFRYPGTHEEVRMQRPRNTTCRTSSIATAMLLIIVAGIACVSARLGYARAESDVTIDLFTQKEPFDGKGSNQSSDMFGPNEIVKLYALVLVEGMPATGSLVTFDINGPTGPPSEIRFVRTAETNSSGVAETEFSLAAINQSVSFGTWNVVASVERGGKVYRDFLAFQVDWLVELLSARTIDQNPPNSTEFPPTRQSFGIGGYVGIEIALRNNAMSQKNPNLVISISDELGRPINSSFINDFALVPSGRPVYIYRNMLIPKFGVPGNATVFVEALDNNSVAYCPQVTTSFWITLTDAVFPEFADVAVYCVDISPSIVNPGTNTNAIIMLRNEGTVPIFNVSVQVSVNGSSLAEQQVSFLDPYESKLLTITWNTSGYSEGKYAIIADVPIIPQEADLTDNTCTGFVEIRIAVKHDIAVTNVTASPSVGYVGDNVSIRVTTVDLGDTSETFNITVYYNSTEIATSTVTSIEPGQQIILNFTWNTSDLAEGSYIIGASAEPVPGEANIENNVFTDGIVTLLSRPALHVRDIAVTGLSANPLEAQVGQNITIAVVVANFGDASESFSLTLFYDSNVIQVIPVASLVAHSQETILYQWNTTDVAVGTYKLRARATILEGEVNTENNSFDDGYVTIQTVQFMSMRRALVYLAFPTFALALIAGLFLMSLAWCSRKRRKKRPQSEHIVIAHLHI